MAGTIDERLVGHWSSLAFSYGVMEATDMGFLCDGRGWSAVYNAYDLTVTRFRWSCPQPGLLELRTEWLVQGESAPLPGRPTFAATQPPEPWTHVTRHRYSLGQEAPAPGAAPLSAVVFEEHVDFAHVLERGSREISIEDDPSYQLLPYTRP
jgi:hypothetical protein